MPASALHVYPSVSPPHHRLPDAASVSGPTSLRRRSSPLLLPKLPPASLTHPHKHHHNMITTPTSTPTRTAMALPKHSHQALFLLHTLVYIMVFFRRHARVFTPALPHFELHPASSQSPRPRRAQGQFTMLFFLHSMLRDLLSELLHRRQPGSPAPSPLTMETVTRHRVNRLASPMPHLS